MLLEHTLLELKRQGKAFFDYGRDRWNVIDTIEGVRCRAIFARNLPGQIGVWNKIHEEMIPRGNGQFTPAVHDMPLTPPDRSGAIEYVIPKGTTCKTGKLTPWPDNANSVWDVPPYDYVTTKKLVFIEAVDKWDTNGSHDHLTFKGPDQWVIIVPTNAVLCEPKGSNLDSDNIDYDEMGDAIQDAVDPDLQEKIEKENGLAPGSYKKLGDTKDTKEEVKEAFKKLAEEPNYGNEIYDPPEEEEKKLNAVETLMEQKKREIAERKIQYLEERAKKAEALAETLKRQNEAILQRKQHFGEKY